MPADLLPLSFIGGRSIGFFIGVETSMPTVFFDSSFSGSEFTSLLIAWTF